MRFFKGGGMLRVTSLLILTIFSGLLNGEIIKTLWKGVEVPLPQKVVIHKGKIFLLALTDRHRIHVYSLKNGKELKTIGRKGTGPGELYMIKDFNIWKDKIYIFELSGSIKIFSLSGKEEMRFPFYYKVISQDPEKKLNFYRFFVLDDRHFILIGSDINRTTCPDPPFFVVNLEKINNPKLTFSFGKVPEGICAKKSRGILWTWTNYMNFSFYRGEIFYYEVDKFKVYSASPKDRKVKVLIAEKEDPYFIPLKGDVKVILFKGGATTWKENYYLPQIRIFPFEGGLWVFLPTAEELYTFTPGVLRKYVYEGGRIVKKQEVKTNFMPLAYRKGIFVGIDKNESLVAFTISNK